MGVITWDKVKQQQLSIGVLIVLGAAVIWFYTWLGATFVTKVEASEYNTQISAQVAGNTRLLNDLTTEFHITAALQQVEALDAKLDRKKAAGVDTETLKELGKDLANAVEYKNCLMDNKPNCALLKR